MSSPAEHQDIFKWTSFWNSEEQSSLSLWYSVLSALHRVNIYDEDVMMKNLPTKIHHDERFQSVCLTVYSEELDRIARVSQWGQNRKPHHLYFYISRANQNWRINMEWTFHVNTKRRLDFKIHKQQIWSQFPVSCHLFYFKSDLWFRITYGSFLNLM